MDWICLRVIDIYAFLIKQIVTTNTRSYFNTRLAQRLNALVQYADAATATYAVRELPFGELHWGLGQYVNEDTSALVCIRDKRVTTWIVGEIIALNFVKEGVATRKAGLIVRPLLQEDLGIASRMLQDLSQPKISTLRVTIICNVVLTKTT